MQSFPNIYFPVSSLINDILSFFFFNPIIQNISPENQKSTCLSFVIVNKPELRINLFGRRPCWHGESRSLLSVLGPWGGSQFPFLPVARPPVSVRPLASLRGSSWAAAPAAPAEKGLGAVHTDHAVASWPDTRAGLQAAELGSHSAFWLDVFLPWALTTRRPSGWPQGWKHTCLGEATRSPCPLSLYFWKGQEGNKSAHILSNT